MNSSFLYHAWGLYAHECTREEYKGNTIILHVQTKEREKVCPKCGKRHLVKNGYRFRDFVGLPIGGGTKMLVPIEWKYTEGNEYNIDKSGTEGSGKERLRRYSQLIDSSCQLVTIPNGYLHTIYFVEPFYQLMRQTLWAEQVIAHKEQELIKADDFIHVHVMPKENEQLLYRKYKYSERGLEDTWRSQISNQKKYKWATPEEIAHLISQSSKYAELVEYLNVRYGYHR